MKQQFIDWKPQRKTLNLLSQIARVIDSYTAQGYRLTLRQLHYQLVAKNVTPNTPRDYERLSQVLTNAREAGVVDWTAIEDRGRISQRPPAWDSPTQILEIAAQQYRVNRWEGQAHYVEVFIEKQALEGLIAPLCMDTLSVNFLACKGYLSASAVYEAHQRIKTAIQDGKRPVIIYAGDHDPSGLHMPLDIAQRLSLYCGQPVKVERVGLTLSQVQQYNLPPNFAKDTDSRWAEYAAHYGNESWELDALDPAILISLIESAVLQYRDETLYQHRITHETYERKQLLGLAQKLSTEGQASV